MTHTLKIMSKANLLIKILSAMPPAKISPEAIFEDRIHSDYTSHT